MEQLIENFSPGLFAWQSLMTLGLILPIIAIIDIMRNEFKGNNKLIWCIITLFMFIAGPILYFIVGTKQKNTKKT